MVNNIITSKQLIFTIIALTIGSGVLTLPGALGVVAKQDGWISILIGGAITLLGLLAINLVARRFPNLTLAEYAEKILGKWLGKLISMTFVLYSITFAATITRTFVSILKMYMFPTTPLWVLILLIITVIAYLAAKSARVLGRVNELMVYESVVLLILLLLALPNIDLTFYRPVGEVGLENIFKGTLKTIFVLLGVEFLVVFYPMVQNKTEFIKAGVIGIAIVTAIYLLIYLISLGTFGPDVLGKIRFSVMVLLKTYIAPIIERAEFFFVIFYIFVVLRPVANMYFAGRYTLEKVIGIQSPVLTTLFLLPFVLVVALYPQNFEQTMLISSNIGYVGSSVFLLALPLLLWGIAVIRGVGVKRKN